MENEHLNEMADTEVVHVDFSQPPKRFKENRIARIVYSVLMLLTGVIFIAARENVFDLLGYIVGGLLLITALTSLISLFAAKAGKGAGTLILGVLELLAGAYCLIKPKTVADLAIYIFALIIFLSGIVMIYFAVRDKKAGFLKWKVILALGIVLALLGAAMLLFVRQSQAVIAVMVGISFIVTALFHVLALFLR